MTAQGRGAPIRGTLDETAGEPFDALEHARSVLRKRRDLANPELARHAAELDNLCMMAVEAYSDAHEKRDDDATILAELLGAAWIATRRARQGVRDSKNLLGLHRALLVYLKTEPEAAPLPPLRGARGGKVRTAAVLDLKARVEGAKGRVGAAVRASDPSLAREIADAEAGALVVTADRTDLSTPSPYDVQRVDAVRDALLTGERVHLIVQRILEATGLPRADAEARARHAV